MLIMVIIITTFENIVRLLALNPAVMCTWYKKPGSVSRENNGRHVATHLMVPAGIVCIISHRFSLISPPYNAGL